MSWSVVLECDGKNCQGAEVRTIHNGGRAQLWNEDSVYAGDQGWFEDADSLENFCNPCGVAVMDEPNRLVLRMKNDATCLPHAHVEPCGECAAD